MTSPEVETRAMAIHLPGLIQLLAENLYSDPDVFLRELLQNAHDSTVKRRALAAGRESGLLPEPRIDVHTDAARHRVVVEDNGAGLSREEMHHFLSTIGRSGTGELRRQLQAGDRRAAAELIGQFGIGLLSAFIVAERVEVDSRAPGQEPVCWTSEGGQDYRVGPGSRAEVGSTVSLQLRPDRWRYADPGVLRAIVLTWADLLGVPVFVDGVQANVVDAPWHRHWTRPEQLQDQALLYWERRFTTEKSLVVWPLDRSFEVGGRSCRVQGVLAVTDRHVPDINTRGVVDVFVSRMFVVGGRRDLLPGWARFIQGVIQCDQLRTNAARDDVMRDEVLEALQKELGSFIVASLVELQAREPRRFVDVMRWHAYSVLGMCVQDEYADFFERIADLVPLRTDKGPMTMAQYLETAPGWPDPASREGRRAAYYIQDAGGAQFILLGQARDIKVIDAGEPFAMDFLQRYAKRWSERVHLVQVDSTSSELVGRLGEGERAAWAELEGLFGRVRGNLQVQAARFAPAELPLLLADGAASEQRRRLKAMAEDASLPAEIREVLKEHAQREDDPLTVWLNADNPTLRALRERPDLGDALDIAVALFNNAYLLRARHFDLENLRRIARSSNQAIASLVAALGLADASRREAEALRLRMREMEREAAGGRAQLSAYPSVFVAMPFAPEHDAFFQALVEALEDAPFFWKVLRADRSVVHHPLLWENVKRLLSQAHCYIAEISDLNPNVMLELGRMEAMDRPMLLFRRADAGEVPADLRGHLHEGWAPGDGLAGRLRESVRRHAVLGAIRGERYLSLTLLRRLGIDPRVAGLVAARFESCEQLLAQEPDQVARQLELKPWQLRAVFDALVEELDTAR